jgi:hypothetical protein
MRPREKRGKYGERRADPVYRRYRNRAQGAGGRAWREAVAFHHHRL